jgi:hypothetical protein
VLADLSFVVPHANEGSLATTESHPILIYARFISQGHDIGPGFGTHFTLREANESEQFPLIYFPCLKGKSSLMRSLSPMCEDLLFQFSKQWTDYIEILKELYEVVGHLNHITFQFLQSELK